MKTLSVYAALISLIVFSCTKNGMNGSEALGDNEAPSIKVISPSTVQNLNAGDPLCMKVVFSDNRQLIKLSWEALDAAAACAGNPYRGEYYVDVRVYDLTEEFTIPPGFAGERKMRFSALDVNGNSAHLDIRYNVNN